MRPGPVGHPARRGERCALPSVGASPDTRRNHVHRTHRDRDHRSRPGRPVHGVPPDEAGPRLRRPGQQRPDRRQLAPALGHPAALQPGEVRRAPRHAVPGRPLDVPPEGRGRRLPRELRTGVRPAGADEHQGRRPGTADRRGLRASHRRQHDHLRQRGRGDRHLRAGAKHPGLRPPARPDGPPAALERVPPPRRPPARTRPGGGCLALRHGHRLRGRADQPGHAVRAGPRPAAVQARAASGEVHLPGGRLRVAARPHPAYPDRDARSSTRCGRTGGR